MTWIRLITFLLVLFWAMLAVYMLFGRRRTENKELEVSLDEHYPDDDDNPEDPKLMVKIANTGSCPVQLQDAGVCLQDKRRVSFVQPNDAFRFPGALDDGDILTVTKGVDEFAELLHWEGYTGEVEVVGFAADDEDTLHVSEAMVLDLDSLRIGGGS